MAFTSVGSFIFNNSTGTLSLTPAGAGHLIVIFVTNNSNNTVTCTALSSTNATWTLVSHHSGTNSSNDVAVFLGRVTSASNATVTPTWSGTAPSAFEWNAHEFSVTSGQWAADQTAVIDAASDVGAWPAPSAPAGELYYGWAGDNGSGVAGTTSGYTYTVPASGDGSAFNLSYSGTAPAWTDTNGVSGIVVLVREIVPINVQPGRPLRRAQELQRRHNLASWFVPPPVTLVNSFGSGTNGASITSGSGGNTAANGNFLDGVNIGSGATVAYDNTHTIHGHAEALQIATGASSVSAQVFWQASIPVTYPVMWFRTYVYLTSLPASTSYKIFTYNQASSANCGAVYVSSAGKILCTDQTGTTRLTSAATVPTGQWFRLEGWLSADPARGQMSFSLFTTNIEAPYSSPDETQTSAAAFATEGGISRCYFGQNTAATSIGPYWLSDVGISSAGPLGPVGAPYVVLARTVTSGTAMPVTGSTAAGDGIYLVTDAGTSSTAVSDSQGNTWVLLQDDSTNHNTTWATTYKGSPGTPTVPLVAGVDTITVTGAGGGGVLAVGVRNASAVDVNPAFTRATTATPSGPATGTLATPGEMILYDLATGGSGASVSSWGSGFATAGTFNGGGAGIFIGYLPVQATTSVTPSATLSSSQAQTDFTVSFITSPVTTVQGTATLSGAGSISDTGTIAADSSATVLGGAGSITSPGGTGSGGTLGGSGSLGALGTTAAPATLAGVAALVTPDAITAAPATLSGQGSVSALATIGAIATLAGQGSVAALATTVPAAVTLAGIANITDAGGTGSGGTLGGVGALGAPPVTEDAPATLAGLGSVITPDAVISAPATLAGQGTVTGLVTISVIATLTGQGTIGDAATIAAPATLTGIGTIFGSTSGTNLGGAGSLSALATELAPASLAGIAALSALASLAPPGTLSGQAALTALAATLAPAQLAAGGALTDTAVQLAPAALAGLGALGAQGDNEGAATLGGLAALAAHAALAPGGLLGGSGGLGGGGQMLPGAVLAALGALSATGGALVQGDTGDVAWEAHSAAARWLASPASRWAARPWPNTWRQAPQPPQWASRPSPPGWKG